MLHNLVMMLGVVLNGKPYVDLASMWQMRAEMKEAPGWGIELDAMRVFRGRCSSLVVQVWNEIRTDLRFVPASSLIQRYLVT